MNSISSTKAFLAIIICTSLLLTGFEEGELTVGVKEGDWIEYTVKTSGAPPKEIAVEWARIEIMNVEETKIITNVTTIPQNGNISSITMTFNLTKGQIGAWFIIPAGLNVGDFFWDESLGRNVAIEGEEELTFAGTSRTITNATTTQRLKRWDKSTGIFVECIDFLDNYSINATATRTNMWGSETSALQQSLPKITFLVSIILVAILAIISISILISPKPKKSKETIQRTAP